MDCAALEFQTYDRFEPVLPEWEALALASRNVFATPEWIRLWWECFGGSESLRLAAVRAPGGRLEALVPLVIRRRGPLRVARFAGHGIGDMLGPIHASNGIGPTLLERVLAEVVTDWDVFIGERLPGDGAWAPALGAAELTRDSNPFLPLGRWPSWDDYLAGLSSKLRYEMRHDEPSVARRHRIHFRTTRDPGQLSSDLDVFFSLHEARWTGRSSFTPMEAFHRRFAAIALDRGWLRLWILEVDDRPVAARYDFEFGRVYNAYNGGRDPAWNKAGVGLVLRAHTMREALDDGVEEYRFLRGGEAYKKRFLTEDAGLVTIAGARTWLGRCARRAGALLNEKGWLRKMARPLVNG
jgi:CelD/BcsL family acetyltransferase involved in cellulose biosynthesis